MKMLTDTINMCCSESQVVLLKNTGYIQNELSRISQLNSNFSRFDEWISCLTASNLSIYLSDRRSELFFMCVDDNLITGRPNGGN